jgi:hypothetical protein
MFAIELVYPNDKDECLSPIFIVHRNEMGVFGNLTRASGRKLMIDSVGGEGLDRIKNSLSKLFSTRM